MSYNRKCGDKKRLNKLVRQKSYFVATYNREYVKRFYMSGKRKLCKHITNKQLRHHKEEICVHMPSYYRKIYDVLIVYL